MSYRLPHEVLSPKRHVQEVYVLHDEGEGKWSLAAIMWTDDNSIDEKTKKHIPHYEFGMRWNGGNKTARLGTPSKGATPMRFLVPQIIAQKILSDFILLLKVNKNEIGYTLSEKYVAITDDYKNQEPNSFIDVKMEGKDFNSELKARIGIYENYGFHIAEDGYNYGEGTGDIIILSMKRKTTQNL